MALNNQNTTELIGTQDSAPYQVMDNLDDEEFLALKRDIACRGVLVPVELDEDGRILDGHHRIRAWQELRDEGVDVPDYPRIVRVGMSEAEKRIHARALNIIRRQLTRERKRELISQQLSETPEISDRQIAKSLGVSPTTVGTVRSSMDDQVSNLNTSLGADGKLYPRKKAAVFVQSGNEEERALSAIASADTLPEKYLDVRRVEQIARKQRQVDEPDPTEAPASDEEADIRTGDYAQVLADLEPESVALITTAPPETCDWNELADFAAQKLKPGGYVLAYCDQACLPDAMTALGKKLDYVWVISVVERGAKTQVEAHKVNSGWKPALVYGKSPFRRDAWIDDVLQSKGSGKDGHYVPQTLSLVEAFSADGDIVVDPFVGGSATAEACLRLGRLFVGCRKELAPAEGNAELDVIDSFRRPYSFLSNFSKAPLEIEGILYPTVEHAFQAAKTHDIASKQKIAATQRADWAKRMGKKVKLRDDWDEVKLDVMRELLNLKFQNEKLATKLVATGEAVLIEGNRWHDNYWGQCSCEDCTGKGQNHLGRLLMELREQMRYNSAASNGKKKHYRAPYAYLSNFHKSPIVVDGITYPSVEHAYQAAKTNDIAEKTRIAATASPVVAKRLGARVQMREDWDAVKRDVMRELLRLKFQDPALAEKLLNTPDAVLMEGSSLLMEIREQLRDSR